jgi:bacterioferritin-associated ferredoxin
VERDVLGMLDAGSRLIAPTFYHHRFLRPRVLRKLYLDVIRGFGGRGRLPVGRASAPQSRVARELEVDVLVVGGGRSGVAAADAATRRGAWVALVEAVAGRARLADRSVTVLDGASAVGWYDGIVTAIDDETLWSIRAASVVAATGSYERVPSVRGADRPGVMGARLVHRLVTQDLILPGERPLLVGDVDELADVAAALTEAGAPPVHQIPTSSLRRVLGLRRVRGAIVDIDGRRRHERVDIVVFADRTPNLDLVLAAGAAVERRDGVLLPVLDGEGRTTVSSLSVVGSAAGGASGVSRSAGRALVCFCEDVHADEIHAQVAAGYGDPELVKRRTGALTGPCQGKYCLQAFAGTAVGPGAERSGLPTARPPLRPVRLGDLVVGDEP